VVLAGLPIGFALGFPPAASCGIVLGIIAQRRERFSLSAAAVAGLAIGSVFAFGRFFLGLAPRQAPDSGLLNMVALFLVLPALVASVLCRSLALRLGAFGNKNGETP
jgi:hypothetical protein